jgi:uncharacterized protein YndB with AHSA1/START domain
MNCALLLATALLGATSGAAPQSPPTCETRDLGHRLLFARGTIEIPAPPQRVFAVVTDYDHLAEFVTAIDSSRVVRRDSIGVVVRQLGTAALIIPHAVHMTLRFHAEPPHLLRFEIVAGDFAVYYGEWRFDTAGEGTRLVHSVTMRPPIFVPMMIVSPSVERLLCRTLTQVRAEVARRDAMPSAREETTQHP